MRNQIEANFHQNINRVKNLHQIYNANYKGEGSGRRGALKTDILRSAVVLLHATLEDFLRSLIIWKYPECQESNFQKIPLKGMSGKNASKFWLSDLVKFRELSVEQLLNDSIKEYANTFSFNRTKDINAVLEICSIICTDNISRTYPKLDQMISRRHNIVHQADKDIVPGRGNHNVKSISTRTVQTWIETVARFVNEVLSCLDNQVELNNCADGD